MSHLTLESLARLVDEAPDGEESAHLESCADCHEELESLRDQAHTLAHLPDLMPPPRTWAAIEDRLLGEGLVRTRRPAARRFTPGTLRLAASIAIFVLGGVAGAWLGGRMGGPVVQLTRLGRDSLVAFHLEAVTVPRLQPVEVGLRAVAGAELAELGPGLADYFEAKAGLLVLRVAPRTPADRAGLRPGDVVVSADGRPLLSVDDLRRTVARPGGDPVRLRVVRKSRTIELRLGAP